MNASDTNQPIRHWIIQARPDKYDLSSKLIAGDQDTWYTKQYRKQIHPNDLAYFIQSGKNTAFHGWGVIQKVVESSGTLSIDVHYNEKFKNLIGLADLAEDPVLKYISRLRIAQGTIFKLTTLEAGAFSSLIEKAENKGPGIFLDDNIPAILLDEYTLSGTPKETLNRGFAISSDVLIKRDLLLAWLHILRERKGHDDGRNDTTSFLGERMDDSTLDSKLGTQPEILNAPIEGQKFSSFNIIDNPFELVSLEVFQVLQLAKEHAIRTTNKERIYTRHLLAAFLKDERTDTILVDLFEDIDGLKSEYLDFLKERYPEDVHDEWKKIITETKTEVPMQSFLARLNADDPDGADLLNIKPEVNALSAVISATDIGPPLAIGLFGDWGSGKTFFMNKIRARVEYLSAESKKKAITESSFCRNVVPIWFNAWHYLDTNLWASLVDHIFDSLERNIEKRKEDARENKTDEQHLEDPLEKLEMMRQMNEELAKKKTDIKKRRQRINGKIGSLKKIKNKYAAEVKKALNSDAFDGMMDIESLKYVQDLMTSFASLRNDWEKENLRFGSDLKNLAANIESKKVSLREVDGLVADTKLLVGDSRRLWQRILVNVKTPYKIGLLTVFITLGVLGAVYFQDALSTILTQVVTIGTLIVTFARGQVNAINRLLDISDSLKEKSNELLSQENKSIENSLNSANENLNRLNDDLLLTNQQLAEVDKELNAIEQMEEGLTSAKRLISFINARARSEDYAKHLGLVSMVRRDFEKLTDLMYPPNEKDRPKTVPVIERIILFIDDLDRCPEEKVMEVLQAVHLLLAFKLFVVVVGVDARWVSRSIKEVHPHLLNEWKHLDGDESAVETLSGNSASTLDYLEKIFQIPFWLKPLDSSEQIKSLIEGTVKDKTATKKTGGEGKSVKDDGDNGNVEDSTEMEYAALDKNIEPNLTPEFLALNELELGFLSVLGSVAGTSPRAIKRFINLYRLVKGTHEEMQSASFNQKKGGYAEVQLILAIQSGHVIMMDGFIQELNKTKAKRFKTFLSHIKKSEHSKLWNAFIDQLSTIADVEPLSIEVMKMYLPKIRRYSYHYSN